MPSALLVGVSRHFAKAFSGLRLREHVEGEFKRISDTDPGVVRRSSREMGEESLGGAHGKKGEEGKKGRRR